MRFLADMGVSQRVAEWLRSEGHDAAHLRDEGLQRLPNGEIFAKAIAGSHGQLASVIVFRLRNGRSANVIARLAEA